MDPLFFRWMLYLGLQHLQRLEKSMSKLTGLHSIFRKVSIFGSNMGFHTLCLQCPQEMFNTECDISGGYRGKLDQSNVHGCVEACCLTFPVQELVPIPGL